MSIFASQTAVTRELPTAPGQTVTIRKLTARETEQCQEVAAGHLTAGRFRKFSERLRRSLEAGGSEVAVALTDPLLGFDRYTVVTCGLTAWSFPEALPDAVADLDDETVEWLALEILRLTKPTRFDDPEALRKND